MPPTLRFISVSWYHIHGQPEPKQLPVDHKYLLRVEIKPRTRSAAADRLASAPTVLFGLDFNPLASQISKYDKRSRVWLVAGNVR